MCCGRLLSVAMLRNVADDSDDDSHNLLQSTGNYLSASDCLPSGVIQMNKCSND